MMVFNELPFLEFVFERLSTFCDHIIAMDNGSTDGSREWLAQQHNSTVILNQQGNPPDYAFLRNHMLQFVPEGAWILVWAPDELPSDGMVHKLRNFLEMDEDRHTGWTIPIYHLMKSRSTCLPMEVGFPHLRLLRKTPILKYHGTIHEQPHISDPWGGIHQGQPLGSGIAIIHLSYFAETRLRRKAEYYASVPGSGFLSPEDLTRRLDWSPLPLPDHITFQADDAWLRRIKETR